MSDRLPPHKLVDIVVNIAELYFDPNNYRIRDPDGSEAVPDERIREPEVQAATRSVLSRKSLGDLRSSIVHNGFLLIDRVVVRRLAGGGYCIVEGNRRIAAFRSLLDEYAEGLRELPSSLLEHARALQVVVIEAEPSAVAQVAAAVMGIRHVSGPMKWTGFQSAGLVHDMYRSGQSLSEIASTMGVSAIEAGRRHRGYLAYLQMREDPEYGQRVEPNHYTLLLEFVTASKKAREWFAWDGSRFTEPTRKYRIFEAMAPPGGRRDAEIQNPASARLFIKHLLIPDHARLLMDGGRLADMPDLPNTGTSLGRLRKARSAIDLVIKCVEEDALEDDEKRALDQLMERIDALRAAVGVDDADG